MFNLFKRKNKIKELELRISVLEGIVTKLNVNETVCHKASITNLEVNTNKFKTKRDKDGGIVIEKIPVVTCCECFPCKDSGELVLQIDRAVMGKVALEEIRKMQRKGNITLITT